MSAMLLPSTVYSPQPPVRRETRNTIIENEPQIGLRRAAPRAKLTITSSMHDDFPTPKASEQAARMGTPDSDASSDVSSMWSNRSSRSSYDDLYDITDDESAGEEIPLKLSASVKKQVRDSGRSRYPSIVIPSPSAWPTIQKLQNSACSIGLSPANNITISPATLSMLNARNLQVPSTSATPSLDGSMSSEELALSSCPSTPDIQVPEGEPAWEPPVQLDPAAFETLHQLTPEEDKTDVVETVLEIPEAAMQEMQEIVSATPRRHIFDKISIPEPAQECYDPLSALSIPSPGGFSLRWTPHPSKLESFYGVPWRTRPENPVERTISVASPQSEGPLTVRRVPTIFSPTEVSEVAEITSMAGPFEYSETYQQELKQTALASFDRTKLWLNAQSTYLTAISEESVIEDFKHIPGAVPSTPEAGNSPVSSTSSPSKKSVRFAEVVTESPVQISAGNDLPVADPTFCEAFVYVAKQTAKHDAFLQRQTRAEALQVYRSSLAQKHRNALVGQFEIRDTEHIAPARPISTFLPTASADSQKEVIAQAERERQALNQVKPSAWELQARKRVFGGKLLTSPAAAHLAVTSDARVLDLGGQAACDWAWAVALEYKNASVVTVPQATTSSSVQGPSNHSVVNSSNPWTLPFPDSHFDVVSARSLHAMLKTSIPSSSTELLDEYDLTLRECKRVLKPSGYLEFNLLDADLVHAGPRAQALSVEFAFNLRTRGYDAAATKNFLPRLARAGFADVKRAWMVLPTADVTPRWTDEGKMNGGAAAKKSSNYFSVEKNIGQDGEVTLYEPALTGSTKDARAMTGLVGARMWERWMLKLQADMGKDECRKLGEVGKALEESGCGVAGWRCLLGWARKA
ncbi:hypothetical protein H2203_005900 [Taxawa tesnikishii (nom. ined.)]|nr:hypothetical protein H2203_005900 [Dothideales sp. JES 119]